MKTQSNEGTTSLCYFKANHQSKQQTFTFEKFGGTNGVILHLHLTESEQVTNIPYYLILPCTWIKRFVTHRPSASQYGTRKCLNPTNALVASSSLTKSISMRTNSSSSTLPQYISFVAPYLLTASWKMTEKQKL